MGRDKTCSSHPPYPVHHKQILGNGHLGKAILCLKYLLSEKQALVSIWEAQVPGPEICAHLYESHKGLIQVGPESERPGNDLRVHEQFEDILYVVWWQACIGVEE